MRLILRSSFGDELEKVEGTKVKHVDCTYLFSHYSVVSTGPSSQEYQNLKRDDVFEGFQYSDCVG